MSGMWDLFRSTVERRQRRDHVLSDEAVLHAVNLGAMVHNLLAAYQQGIETGDFDRYRRKMYELSIEFYRPEVREARENMRMEWVRRVEAREQ